MLQVEHVNGMIITIVGILTDFIKINVLQTVCEKVKEKFNRTLEYEPVLGTFK
jgi:hypothetical protein